MNTQNHMTARQQGFSLIELLVAMVIGLVVTLAASSVLLNFEGNKRKMTSVNDINQAGAYISYVLDRSVRSAGSGFASRGDAFGCSINASRDNTAILPAPQALPAPFAALDRNFRLAPVLIYAGASESGSDVVAFMKGSHGFGESPALVVPGSVTATQVRMLNTLGWRNNDMALVLQQGQGCLIEQVSGAGFAGSTDQVLPFNGAYYTAAGTNVDLADFGGAGGGDTYVAALGNVVDNRPEFQVVGVGADNTLFSYDLLRFEGAGTAPQTIADGVVELRAVYGIDANTDGVRDGWVSPSAAGFTSASLLDGTAAATNRLRSIVAVRIGLILRTSTPEKEAVSPAELTLFSDLGPALEQKRTLTANERLFRHRTIELTVPLRNVLTSNLN
jgi:type IV pilus assembly protein PilW